MKDTREWVIHRKKIELSGNYRVTVGTETKASGSPMDIDESITVVPKSELEAVQKDYKYLKALTRELATGVSAPRYMTIIDELVRICEIPKEEAVK